MIFNKNCVGAVDGVHFPVTVGVDEQGPFRNKNGFLSQNVLAACSFDMKFHYVLAGWEGSAPHMQVLSSALTRRNKLVVPDGKYYLVDAKYASIPGFVAPYPECRIQISNSAATSTRKMPRSSSISATPLFTTSDMGKILLSQKVNALFVEYGSEGLVSTMVDVYSYGILLMEICSRRKPTDEVFSGELTMRKWMQKSFPNYVMHIVDNEVVNMDVGGRRVEYGSCFTSITELALECTEEMPEERPTMKSVLARMKKIKSNLSQGN